MILDPGELVFERTVREQLPATLYGCRWAVVRGSGLPEPVKPEPGREDWFYPLRVARDGRVIAMAGLPQPDQETARKWAEADMAVLAQAEEDYFRATGRAPDPMEPAAVSFGGLAWEPRAEAGTA